MGVKSCSRQNCDNIMCDVYVPRVGYVCDECCEEFKTYVEIADEPIHEGNVVIELSVFMNIPKNFYRPNKPMIDIDEFFNQNRDSYA